MARGKLRVDLLPDTFPGGKPEGAETFVKHVHRALACRFRSAVRPPELFTDRGAWFFNPGSGVITLFHPDFPHPVFSTFWKPVCSLDIHIWHR